MRYRAQTDSKEEYGERLISAQTDSEEEYGERLINEIKDYYITQLKGQNLSTLSNYYYQGHGNKAFICIPDHAQINEAFHVTQYMLDTAHALKEKDKRSKFQGHWLSFDSGGLGMVNPKDITKETLSRKGAKKHVATITYSGPSSNAVVYAAWNSVPENPFATNNTPNMFVYIARFLESVAEHITGKDIVVCYEDVSWQNMFCVPAMEVYRLNKQYVTRHPTKIYGPTLTLPEESQLQKLYFKMNYVAEAGKIVGDAVPNYSDANLGQNMRIPAAVALKALTPA